MTIANSGKRCICRCIASINMNIGKEDTELFTKGKIYNCMIRESHQTYYKVYGDEFDLSCTYEEFKNNFVVIKQKKQS